MKRVNGSVNLFIGTTMSNAIAGLSLLHQTRYDGFDVGILAKRKALYQTIRNEHPERWSKEERIWQPIGDAALNPEQHKEAAYQFRRQMS